MRNFLMIGFLACAPLAAAQAQSPAPQPAAPAPAAIHYSTDDTDLGTLIDDPAAKAILAKYIPEILASDQIDMARGLTLRALQSYASDKLTDAKLAAIDTDLAKLPVKK